MNGSSQKNSVYNFKKVIDDIVDTNLINKGITKYISAKVVSVNSNGTVNVYIPPDTTNKINGLANKSGEILFSGDSVELCAKNGSVKNSWIAVKHGIGTVGGSGTNYDALPVGSIVFFSGTKAPDGYLFCMGQEVSRTERKDLFAAIGTIYGEGDGTTTFNLPDMRGKVGIGLDSTDTYFDTLGKSGGNKFHSHNYKIGWYGYYSAVANIDGQALATYDYPKSRWNYGGSSITNMVNSTSVNANLAQGANSTTQVVKQASEAGTSDNNNIQPYITVNYIIKASGTAILQGNVVDSLTSDSTLNAPSIHAVNEGLLDKYSTEEKRIGTWIDGKPLYRKVFVVDNNSTTTEILVTHNIQNFGELIDVGGSVRSYTSWKSLPHIYVPDVAKYGVSLYNLIPNSTFSLLIGTQLAAEKAVSKIIVILKYTKTTD